MRESDENLFTDDDFPGVPRPDVVKHFVGNLSSFTQYHKVMTTFGRWWKPEQNKADVVAMSQSDHWRVYLSTRIMVVKLYEANSWVLPFDARDEVWNYP